MLRKLNFLTTPDSYTLALPSHIDPVPSMRTVTTLEGAPRDTLYEPASRRADPASEGKFWKHHFDITSHGIVVSVYEQRQSPHQFAAFWRLPLGYVVAWTGDPDETSDCQDGRTAIETVIRSLLVEQRVTGPPRLTLRLPLQPGDLRDPTQRDTAMFWPLDGTWPVVQVVKEPPWATERTQTTVYGDMLETAVTTANQVTVKCAAPKAVAGDLQRTASDIANSLN